MKITKKQLRRIIKEIHPSRGVNFDITLDKAIQSDGLGTSDVITRDDFYEMIYDFGGELGRPRSWFDSQVPKLDKMNIQQVSEFYEDMFHSPEYKEMKAGFDKEDQAAADAELGHERDLSSLERSPKRQGMSRRKLENKITNMRMTENQLRFLVREALLSEGKFADIVRGIGRHGSKILTRPAGIIAKVFGRLATSGDSSGYEDRIDANVEGLEELVGDLLYLPGRTLEVGYEELKNLVKKYKPDAKDEEIAELEDQITKEKMKSSSGPSQRMQLAAESRMRKRLKALRS